MKEIKEIYDPVEESFKNTLQDLVKRRKFIRLHYFNDFHEYISAAAIIKNIESLPQGEFAILNTGEKVRLDKIVRLEGLPAPGYSSNDFTCDC